MAVFWLERLLEALAKVLLPATLIERGHQALEKLRVLHPAAPSLVKGWLDEVEVGLDGPAPGASPAPPAGRKSWWKR